MYIPKSFEMNDPTEITNFIQANSFGILVSTVDGTPCATHLPFFYDTNHNILMSHMAKANPQWQNLDGQPVLVVFSGPHAYISPSWYEVPASVPTWNYVAVHVYGKCTVIDSEEPMAELLERVVRFYEPDSALPSQADEPFYRNMMKAIVGFRIDITRVQAAAKLSQNKPVEVQERVIANLSKSTDAFAQRVAQVMLERLNGSARR
ncbi:FMN-binding negative transcriptional regulator [Alicyclobacillus fastidiosus]|uniref:FMN-binding negative transcriptional regulator n=1 Tax=Alicyclobacillus fastidiosus TaxID=392011 RepID=A0ABY6ZA93_9BACL|nr:FMN-binding negative transcriptional regulator [Alicyclobacillus fastidiosus]WAH39792.1 FMN-binding negative transcriptional regulator [Alicyclobacillus fastidiosus]GMA61042.1 protease synthase and sporulation protein PAI 2 [Alicyclobacillus fastidiosus]